jgi:pimeloyl-ACP methyl ester carboxylesterase
VGWSLGGVVAREVARQRPDLVSSVVTMGTPIVGGPTYTAAARFFGKDASRAAGPAASRAARSARIQVPLTVIFSRADGVVDWRASIDRATQGARHVEVRSTHVGLGIDPDVWWAVARALAEPPRPAS